MKLILSKRTAIELSKEDSVNFRDEMRHACSEVSVFPVMERILGLMEA